MLLRLLHFAWSASLTFIPSMSSRPRILMQNNLQAFELKKSDDRKYQETQRILLQNSPNAFRQMNSDHRKDIEPQQALLQNSLYHVIAYTMPESRGRRIDMMSYHPRLLWNHELDISRFRSRSIRESTCQKSRTRFLIVSLTRTFY